MADEDEGNNSFQAAMVTLLCPNAVTTVNFHRTSHFKLVSRTDLEPIAMKGRLITYSRVARVAHDNLVSATSAPSPR